MFRVLFSRFCYKIVALFPESTFFCKVVENGDFANAIDFVLFINGSDVGISNVAKITIGMYLINNKMKNIYRNH